MRAVWAGAELRDGEGDIWAKTCRKERSLVIPERARAASERDEVHAKTVLMFRMAVGGDMPSEAGVQPPGGP